MLACHAGGPGSIPGQCNITFSLTNDNITKLKVSCITSQAAALSGFAFEPNRFMGESSKPLSTFGDGAFRCGWWRVLRASAFAGDRATGAGDRAIGAGDRTAGAGDRATADVDGCLLLLLLFESSLS